MTLFVKHPLNLSQNVAEGLVVSASFSEQFCGCVSKDTL